jgi:CRISPR-associated protein Csh2
MTFTNRVFGCAVVRAINANYNADFSSQPRTLPNGRVYATDKAFKYLVKNYIKDNFSDETVFYFKSQKEDFNPRSLEETYEFYFSHKDKEVKDNKSEFANNLLKCIDIRCFGATFAMKAQTGDNVAISIHGPVQINHGVNIWEENNIYSEQIMSPFANLKEKKSEEEKDKGATTLGRQSKLQEGHYLHHFSINPKNLNEIVELAGEGANNLSNTDIEKLKAAFGAGASYFDSSSKAGIDNELVFWVQLKSESKKVLPTFNNLITMRKEANKSVFDFSGAKAVIDEIKDDIENIEVYYLKESVDVENLPNETKKFDIISGNEIQEI